MSAFYYSHKYCADNFILKKCGVVSFKYLFENMRMKYKKKTNLLIYGMIKRFKNIGFLCTKFIIYIISERKHPKFRNIAINLKHLQKNL